MFTQCFRSNTDNIVHPAATACKPTPVTFIIARISRTYNSSSLPMYSIPLSVKLLQYEMLSFFNFLHPFDNAAIPSSPIFGHLYPTILILRGPCKNNFDNVSNNYICLYSRTYDFCCLMTFDHDINSM